MNLLDIILLAFALAMDCLSVSIVCGVISRRLSLRMAFLFGLFQGLMPLVGWLGISWFSVYLQAVDHWIAFLLLAFIGGRMVKDAFEERETPTFDPQQLRTQLLLAVATSIDALAVGISFACTGRQTIGELMVPLLVIGLVSFLLSLVGSALGIRFGRVIIRRLKPELLGGLILIGIGLKILIYD